jgi:hypothetical protein
VSRQRRIGAAAGQLPSINYGGGDSSANIVHLTKTDPNVHLTKTDPNVEPRAPVDTVPAARIVELDWWEQPHTQRARLALEGGVPRRRCSTKAAFHEGLICRFIAANAMLPAFSTGS